MISLGRRRDAREELGLGFVSEREMEDTELEEGEACSYHNNNNNIVDNDDDYDYDASVDPDISLSYIDEKLQDVLGHFQKDFEGGVSAENLGAKFGGYGSFLPAYQRSPVWSHPRTPQKIQHCNASRSPNTLQLEGGRHSFVSSSTASQSIRPEPPPVLKTSCSLNEPAKQEACVPSAHFAGELVPKDESINRKSANLPDQKMLKVRIKVGSDNLSTRKNAAIYSGLGLDVSPFSSPDDSPSGSEGMSHELQYAFLESPELILQKMTSFPVDGGLLVSPLSDDVLHLKEKQKFPKDSELSVPRFVRASSGTVEHWSDAVKGDGTMLGEKKIKTLPRNEILSESKNHSNEDSRSVLAVISQEKELDSIACEELVSNALKLPLLSSSHSATVDTTKGLDRLSNVSKGGRKDKGFSDSTKESSVTIFTQENGRINNSKSKSSGKVWEDKKVNALDIDSICHRKEGHRKGEKPGDSGKIDPDSLKGRKALNHAPTDPLKQTTGETAACYEQEGMKLPYVKELSPEGKKRLKGSQSHGTAVAEALKENSRVGSSLPPKNKKSTHADNYAIKAESTDLKLQKNTGKTGDRYRAFFGDIELEQEENQLSPLETSYEDRPKDSEMAEKSTHTNSMPKEGPNSKKVDKLLTSEAFPKATSGALHYGDGPIPDVASGEDSWVCCDKCQTWRLLPLHTNPDDLPEKWLCSMLDWLPGMNRCGFSEDETTHATRLFNLNNPGGNISKVTSADIRLTDQNHQNFNTNAMLTGGRKKHGSKEIPSTVYKDEDGPAQLSNSMKKSLQASMANGSLNNVKLSTVVREPDALKPNKSSRLSGEKHKHKPREKHRLLDNCSDRGGSKRSKMKDKRDPDQDCFRASKKSRTEGLPEDWISIDGGAIEKVGPSSGNGLATVSLGKDLSKYNDPTSSKDSKHDRKDRVQLSAKKPKDEVQVSLDNGSVDMEKYDDRDVTRKRKLKESHDAQIYPGSLLNTGHHLQNSTILAREEFSENDYRKNKKARVSRSEGKEASGSKGNGRTDKKGSHRKNQKLGHDLGNTQLQRSLDGVDSSKRDSGSLHLAATSSSSKVSGSHKNKANFHEAKGSPVESVSSSPMRVSKLDKLSSARKDAIKKDKSADTGFGLGGLRKFSDGEDDGGSDRSGTARKEKALKVVPSPDFADGHLINGGVDFLGKDIPCASNSATLVRCQVDERQNENHQNVNGSRPRKSGKSSSSRSKDKNRNINFEFENCEAKVSDCIDAQEPSREVKPTDSKNKIEEKFRIKSEEKDKRCVDKNDSVDVMLSDNRNRESLSNVGGPSGSDVKVHAICSHDAASTPKQSVMLNGETVSEQGKSLSLHSSGGAQNDTPAFCPHPTSGSHRGNGANSLAANASGGDGETKALKHMRKADHPNGINHHHPNSSRNAMSNGHRVRDLDAPSPVKRDSSSQAANNALKEAKSLKHMADRVKNSGSNLESTKLYFEAALKFLHGASLLENCSGENAKTGEMVQWMQVYRSTAKLCEFCAHEYEKSKDMAAAALAYKCMEVAYMRVIYSSHTCANRDRHELQTAFQIIPPGESPSSSASDIDNLNHPTTLEKVPLAKGISSPQVTGSHIIAARNRPNFLRLLNFAQDTHFAMEASRKSRMAFAVAITNLGEAECGEGISSIKTALDFNFQDVEGLLRLVRLAVEAISR